MSPGHARYLERGHPAAAVGYIQFDFLFRQFAVPQLSAKGIPRGCGCGIANQGIQDAFLRRQFGLGLNGLSALFAYHGQGNFHQIADDLFHVPAHISNFGKFSGFNLDERRAGQAGQTAGDFRLTDTGGADHQNILRHHFFAHGAFQLHAPPAVAQGDGDRALGIVLADDKAVQFGNNLPGAEFGHGRRDSRVTFSLV